MTDIPINADRLWQSLMDMAVVGKIGATGCCRLALTDADTAGRQLFLDWAKDAGCTAVYDDVGNLFVRRSGANPQLPPVVMGSHLDTQANGGRFDGVLGVLAGLEVLRSLNDHDVVTQHPLEVAVWTNEEGVRFSPAMMGSGVFAGVFDVDAVRHTADDDGITVAQALAQQGVQGDCLHRNRPLAAYLELHIEQGPILEHQGKRIGVVQGVQGIRWYDLRMLGVATHAGPTPMAMRVDAAEAAGRAIGEIMAIGRCDEYARATVGKIHFAPGSRNVVPDRADLSIDLRHPDPVVLERMHQRLEQSMQALAASQEGLEANLEEVWHSPPVVFDQRLVSMVSQNARALGLDAMNIVSGAGHDAVYVSRVAPTAMVFIPCQGGVSHNPDEQVDPRDVQAGAQVLARTVLQLAGSVPTPLT